MKYRSIKTNEEVEIDVATATLEQLVDAYDSLLERSAFPAKTAKHYADELRVLIDARPDLQESCSCPHRAPGLLLSAEMRVS